MECESITNLVQSVDKLLANQPPENEWIDVWLSPLSALVGIVLTATLSYLFGFRTQIKVATLRTKQESFGSLMGYKYSLSQLYVSRFEARIHSDFHERRWNLLGDKDGALDFEEAQRWMHKSENLTDFISEKNEKLFSTIGTIKSVFQKSPELDKLVAKIYRFKTPTITPIPNDLSLEELNRWSENAVDELQNFVRNEISRPIDELLEYLETHGQLNAQKRNWWRLFL